MGKLWNLLQQKFSKASLKNILVKFRRLNGAWIEFQIKPGKKNFTFKNNKDIIYRIKGIPDIDDETNQRTYNFYEGVPYPITHNSQQPKLIEVVKSDGNEQIELNESEEIGFQRAQLLYGKKQGNMELMILICVAVGIINLILTFMIMDKLGIKLF